jgi:hypothetical protein
MVGVVADPERNAVFAVGRAIARFWGADQTLPLAVSVKAAFYLEEFPPDKTPVGCTTPDLAFSYAGYIIFMVHCPMIGNDFRFFVYNLTIPTLAQMVADGVPQRFPGANLTDPTWLNANFWSLQRSRLLVSYTVNPNVKQYTMSFFLLRYPLGTANVTTSFPYQRLVNVTFPNGTVSANQTWENATYINSTLPPTEPYFCYAFRRKISVVTSYFELTCFSFVGPFGDLQRSLNSNSTWIDANSITVRIDDSSFTTVTTMLYAAEIDTVYIFGTNDRGVCLGYGVQLSFGNISSILTDSFNIDGGTCKRVDTGITVNGSLLLGMNVAGKPRLAQFRYLVPGSRWVLPRGEGGAYSTKESILQMRNLPLSGLIYVVSNDDVQFTSKFVKLEFDRTGFLSIAGSQELSVRSAVTPSDKRIAGFTVAHEQRIAFLVQRRGTAITLRRFAMYEATRIFPAIADRRGGTLITVSGRGFLKIPGQTASCLIGSSSLIPATIINSTTLVCTAQRSDDTTLCNADTVEVAMFERVYTTNKIKLQRYASPFLAAASPKNQWYTAGQTIDVSGIGFVQTSPETSVVRCRYFLQLPNGTTVQDTEGRAPSTEFVQCAPPALNTSAVANLSVALDGSIFAAEVVPVTFIGEASGLKVSPPSVQIRSDLTVTVPTLIISFVDASGNPLQSLFTDRVDVSVSRRGWVPSGLPTDAMPTIISGDQPVDQVRGTATFSSIVLSRPRMGNLELEFRAWTLRNGVALTWTVFCTVTIVPGLVARVVVVNQPGPTIDAGGGLDSAASIRCEDMSGNPISPDMANGLSVNIVVVERLQPGIVLPPSIQRQDPPVFPNVTMVMSEAFLTVTSLDSIRARGGFEYQLLFEVKVSSAISATGETTVLRAISKPMTPRCNVGNYRPIGSQECTACLPNAVCTGNLSMIVDQGYWRSSLYAAAVYACEPKASCLGGGNGSACSPGYTGPLCRVCQPGYGKSIGGNCVACMNSTLAVALFALLSIAVIVALSLAVVLASQNWNRNSNTVVICMVLVTQLQTVVQVGSLDAGYPTFFVYSISWISAFFDVRFLDVSFADCLMRADGTDFLVKFAVFSATPLIAVGVAVFAWLILFLWPNFLKLADGYQYERDANHIKDWREHLRKKAKLRQELQKKGDLDEQELEDKLMAEEGRFSSRMDEIIAESEAANSSNVDNLGEADELKRTYKFLSITSIQVTVFFTMPSTVIYTMAMFVCLTITDDGGFTSGSFLWSDMSISCNTEKYKAFRIFAIFSLIIYVVMVPALYVVGYWATGRIWSDTRSRRKQLFSFMLQGLRAGGWYWPALIYLRKAILCIITASLKRPLDSYFSTWVLTLYLPAIHFLNPYTSKLTSMLEGFGIAACLLMLNLGLIIRLVEDKLTESDFYILTDAIGAINLGIIFLVVLVFFYFTSERMRLTMRHWFKKEILHDLTESDSEDEDRPAGRKDVLESRTQGEGEGEGATHSEVRDVFWEEDEEDAESHGILELPSTQGNYDPKTAKSRALLDGLTMKSGSGSSSSGNPRSSKGGKKKESGGRHRAPMFEEVDSHSSGSHSHENGLEEHHSVYIPKPLPAQQRMVISFMDDNEREKYLMDPTLQVPSNLTVAGRAFESNASANRVSSPQRPTFTSTGANGSTYDPFEEQLRSTADDYQREQDVGRLAAQRATSSLFRRREMDDDFQLHRARRDVMAGRVSQADLAALAGTSRLGASGSQPSQTTPRRNQALPPPRVISPSVSRKSFRSQNIEDML